jgi:hypothetical protein
MEQSGKKTTAAKREWTNLLAGEAVGTLPAKDQQQPEPPGSSWNVKQDIR